MATPLWSAGALKQPGDLVRPTSSGEVVAAGPDNPAFDDGDSGWTFTGSGSHTIDTDAPVFNGTYSAKLGVTSNPNATSLFMTNNARLPVVPGQVVTLRAFVLSNIGGDYARLNLRINWYNAAMAELAPTLLDPDATNVGGEARINGAGLSSAAANGVWVQIETSGVAPAGATSWTAAVSATWGDSNWIVDNFSWEYAGLEPPNNNLYRAVQAAAGFTGNVEPDWPTSVGLTVIDNEVTWECVPGTSVTWQAQRILVSGTDEPLWPLTVNAQVADNTIAWSLNSRRVTDARCPQSQIVALAASKVYAADDDIIDYSATTNPLDWSTAEDAGFIPFGLNTYGANPVAAMGLYRGNLAAFNSVGCQVWQVDEDPRAITILDALPFGCTFPKSVTPVGDDLAFLSSLGIRSLGTAGAQVNLQGGYFGMQIDPLVVAALKAATRVGQTPRGLYWPAQGQAWWFFGSQAFVLTIQGDKREERSWARYTFPWVVDAWTLMGDDLYLRAGDLVEKVDPDILYDDALPAECALEAEQGGWGEQVARGFMTFAMAQASSGSPPDGFGDAGELFFGYTLQALFISQSLDLHIVLSGEEAVPDDDAFEQLVVETTAGTLTLLAADAQIFTAGLPPFSKRWTWIVGAADFVADESYDYTCGDAVGTPFTSVIQWPFLDFKTFNVDKELIGFDLAIEGVCTLSFGWDQRNLEYAADSTWTVPFEVDGDTVPGQMVGFSMTGPSFAMRLEFESGQEWKWYSANLYVNDTSQ